VGLHVCRTPRDYEQAHAAVVADQRKNPTRCYMVERAVLGGRELTVGLLDGRALPTIEIIPASGLYDYEAKYNRDDTRYQLAPRLPAGVEEVIQSQAASLAGDLGIKHVARVDFILDSAGTPWLLEINSMPGFTGHSLLPMAAKHEGLAFPALAAALVALAQRDGVARPVPAR